MNLRFARLCLDCEEVHEEQHCPVCGSAAFAFLSRWVDAVREPPPERAARPPEKRPEVAVYRRLLVADAVRPKAVRLLKQGAVGLAMVSLARYVWRNRPRSPAPEDRGHSLIADPKARSSNSELKDH